MYNITAYLTIKNKTFYTVLTYYVDGIRKMKWDYAVQTDLIPNNPAIKVGRPQQEQFIADYYNEDESNNLFKVVKDTPLELIVYLTAFYGLRRSEVLGIRWSAIDFENKTITISHKVVTVTNESEDSKTKTKMITKSKTKINLVIEHFLYLKKLKNFYYTLEKCKNTICLYLKKVTINNIKIMFV